jgi:hypothetical protein
LLLLVDLLEESVELGVVAVDESAAAVFLLDFLLLVDPLSADAALALSVLELLLDFFDDLAEVLASAESGAALLLLLDFVDAPLSEAVLSAVLDFFDDDFLAEEDEVSPGAAESSVDFFFFDFDLLLLLLLLD